MHQRHDLVIGPRLGFCEASHIRLHFLEQNFFSPFVVWIVVPHIGQDVVRRFDSRLSNTAIAVRSLRQVTQFPLETYRSAM